MTTAEFNECVDQYSDNLYRFILKHIRDTDKAKDIVQDTYEKMWRKVSDTPAKNAKSYLFTTAHHTLIDHVRRDSKRTGIEDADWENLSHSGQYSDLKQVLDEALNKLPAIQKSVVLLRDYEGYDYSEIGEITGLNESQVKVYIYRARVFLKNYIGSPDKVI